MRDKRCDKEYIEKWLNYRVEKVERDFKRVEEYTKYVEDKLYEDEYDKRRKIGLIKANNGAVIEDKLEIISYKYTLGVEVSELHKEYLVISDQIDKIVYNSGFVYSDIFALGILFEEGIDKFNKLISIMDKYKSHDLLCDYLINGCGLRKGYYSDVFVDDVYKFSKELIELAQKDREKASKKLVYYFRTNWNEPVVEELYHGLWLWGYAAIAKMFKLDDSELKDNPYYPYELAHYKSEMEFMPEKMMDFPKENYKKGIPEYPRLEKLIPVKFHEMTNNFFVDFKELSDEDFYDKYIIDWIDFDDYVEQKDDIKMFGETLIYFLADNFCILAFDKLDDLRYVDSYKSYWGRKKIKPINFDLEGDVYYIAYVPKSMKLKSIFGIRIDEVKDLKGFDQYAEYFGQFDGQ